jgi:CO/xanthine dehydrogenase Mo-binding subunit
VRLETSVGAQDDRAEAIDVDYEPLPPVLDMRTALEPGSPKVHPCPVAARGDVGDHTVPGRCGITGLRLPASQGDGGVAVAESSKRMAVSAADGGHWPGRLEESGIVDVVSGQFGGDGPAPGGG